MGVCQLKKHVRKLLRINDSMPICDYIVHFCKKNNFLDERKLSYVYVPKGRWEEGLGKAIAARILTALHSPGFKTAVRNRVEYEGTEKDPSEVIIIMSPLNTEWYVMKKFEAGRKEASRKAAGKGGTRRGGKQQRAGPCCGGCFNTNRQGTC